MVKVKLVPAVRAVTAYRAGIVALQVTLNRVLKPPSYSTKISLLAVTAVVLTTTEVAAASATKDPAAALPQAAAPALSAQFVAVVKVVPAIWLGRSPVTKGDTEITDGAALVARMKPTAGAPGSVNMNAEVTLVGH